MHPEDSMVWYQKALSWLNETKGVQWHSWCFLDRLEHQPQTWLAHNMTESLAPIGPMSSSGQAIYGETNVREKHVKPILPDAVCDCLADCFKRFLGTNRQIFPDQRLVNHLLDLAETSADEENALLTQISTKKSNA